MDTEKFVKAAVGIAIILLLILTFVTPILDGVNYTKTEQNTPTGYATASIKPGDYTLIDQGFAIDGTFEAAVPSGDWIILSDTICLSRDGSYLRIIDFEAELSYLFRALHVDTEAGTWSGTTTGNVSIAGNLGTHAIAVSSAGEIGIYNNVAFTVDKSSDVITFATSYNDFGLGARAKIMASGTIDNLKVDGIFIHTSNQDIFIQNESSTIQCIGYSADKKTFTIDSNVTFSIDFEYNGQSYHTNVGIPPTIAGPLTYTAVTNGPIESMIDVVPLIMIAGVIITIVGAFIVRRI